ncbi:PREDICTED: protein FAM151B isoform X1 [Lepidothrix coronata]|uniref:Protein FAM151B isoform X1 n=1 Tax=Lepidothrix coronata TaxID=321398 RepID=A0A6J0GIQ1_9PASS|nr:PREDICTED: protein FAM151B isoform X1 [Lepidothrix coronata]
MAAAWAGSALGKRGQGRGAPSVAGSWSEWPVDHFFRSGCITARDGAAVRWFHAANSRARAAAAARSNVHMVEADVLLRGGEGGKGDPILAHPPDTDSDITLQEWLTQMVNTNKGIKLDFKSAFPGSRGGPPQPGRRGTIPGAAGAGGAAAEETCVDQRGHPGGARWEPPGAECSEHPRHHHLDLPRHHPVPGLDHRLARPPPRARGSLSMSDESILESVAANLKTSHSVAVREITVQLLQRVRLGDGGGDVPTVPGPVPARDIPCQGRASAALPPCSPLADPAVRQVQPHCLDRKGRHIFCRGFAFHPRKF